jgi:hypothetical protein
MAALFTVYYAYVSAVIVDCVKQTNITKSVVDAMFDNMALYLNSLMMPDSKKAMYKNFM